MLKEITGIRDEPRVRTRTADLATSRSLFKVFINDRIIMDRRFFQTAGSRPGTRPGTSVLVSVENRLSIYYQYYPSIRLWYRYAGARTQSEFSPRSTLDIVHALLLLKHCYRTSQVEPTTSDQTGFLVPDLPVQYWISFELLVV